MYGYGYGYGYASPAPMYGYGYGYQMPAPRYAPAYDNVMPVQMYGPGQGVQALSPVPATPQSSPDRIQMPSGPQGSMPPQTTETQPPPYQSTWSPAAPAFSYVVSEDPMDNVAPGATCCPPPLQDLTKHLFNQDKAISVRGWFDGGYLTNAINGQPSNFNGPYNSQDLDYGMFNQVYLIVEKKLPTCGFGVGGRIDALYGEDFFVGQSLGFELNRDGSKKWNGSQYYGVAVPQAYGEMGNEKLSVKAGHFYNIVDYEGLPSLANFFYSHSYSYQFAGPFTEWGALATYRPNAHWQFQAGAANRWNTLDGDNNRLNYLGSIKYTGDCNKWYLYAAVNTGQEETNPSGQPDIADSIANRTRVSVIYDQKIGDCNRWEYVLYPWLGYQKDGAANDQPAWWYGVDQYLYFRFSEQWQLGTRVEWFRDEEGTRVGLNRPANPNKPPFPGNFVSVSLGLNYLPVPNVLFRPEIRYDVYDGPAHPYNDGTKDQQLLLGVDLILKF
jgi:hypothetical protein